MNFDSESFVRTVPTEMSFGLSFVSCFFFNERASPRGCCAVRCSLEITSLFILRTLSARQVLPSANIALSTEIRTETICRYTLHHCVLLLARSIPMSQLDCLPDCLTACLPACLPIFVSFVPLSLLLATYR